MGIGENIYNLMKNEGQFLIYIALGVKFAFSKKFTQLIGVLVALIIAVGLLQFPDLVKGFFESIFKAVVPAQT